MKALLIGREPELDLGYSYVTQPPYDAVVIGSLTFSQLLQFSQEPALEALAQGKSVLLYTPGLPDTSPDRRIGGCSPKALPSVRDISTWASFRSGPSTATF